MNRGGSSAAGQTWLCYAAKVTYLYKYGVLRACSAILYKDACQAHDHPIPEHGSPGKQPLRLISRFAAGRPGGGHMGRRAAERRRSLSARGRPAGEGAAPEGANWPRPFTVIGRCRGALRTTALISSCDRYTKHNITHQCFKRLLRRLVLPVRTVALPVPAAHYRKEDGRSRSAVLPLHFASAQLQALNRAPMALVLLGTGGGCPWPFFPSLPPLTRPSLSPPPTGLISPLHCVLRSNSRCRPSRSCSSGPRPSCPRRSRACRLQG